MICMMNVPYVVLKYATLLLSFPINNVVEVVLTTLSTILKCTNNPSHLQGIGSEMDQFPALKCVGVNNVSRVGICCFLYYKDLLICNIVV